MLKKSIVARPCPSPDTVTGPDCDPVLQRIYLARNVFAADDLDYSLARLPGPDQLGGMENLVRILTDCILNQSKMVVVADFDADGATSCAVLLRGLKTLGAKNPGFLVPNRFEYGYGLTPEIVEVAAGLAPDVIITVDNGISSLEGVKEARGRGIRVVVTDHHLPGPVLPDADAIVNPNLPGDPFPSRAIAGVGVVFYCLLGLRRRLRELNWFGQHGNPPEPNLACLLDLVALGTVADVVPLDRVNRILVSQGVRRIRQGAANAGIQALLAVAGRSAAEISASDLGFAVAPRLNAAGRLDDMSVGIECLLTDNSSTAWDLAEQLDSLNQERKEIESRMRREALELLQDPDLPVGGDYPRGLCLFDPGWHQGVVGILASRIREKTGRPVIAFALDENGDLKGSARSVSGVHIRDVLCDVAAASPDVLNRFGGHAMAAGLTLPRSRLEEFSGLFSQVVARYQGDGELEHVIYSDGELEPHRINQEFAQRLENAGPWGQGFPEPRFHGCFEVLETRLMKAVHLRFKLACEGGTGRVEAVAFSVEDAESWLQVEHLRIVYRLTVNEFRNRRTVQLVIDYMEPVEDTATRRNGT